MPVPVPVPVRAAAAVALAVAFTSSCATNVVIDRPPPTSTSETTRRDYYVTHKAEKAERGQLVARTRLGQKRPTFTQKSVQLANGLVVEDPSALRPLVHDESEAARAIDTAIEARSTSTIILGAGGAVALIGVAAGGTALALYILDPTSPGAPNAGEVVDPLVSLGGAGIAVGLVGGIALSAWGMTIVDEEADARTKAFRTFNDGLWQKLGLAGSPPSDDDVAPDAAAARPDARSEARTPSQSAPSAPSEAGTSPSEAGTSPSEAGTPSQSAPTAPSEAGTTP